MGEPSAKTSDEILSELFDSFRPNADANDAEASDASNASASVSSAGEEKGSKSRKKSKKEKKKKKKKEKKKKKSPERKSRPLSPVQDKSRRDHESGSKRSHSPSRKPRAYDQDHYDQRRDYDQRGHHRSDYNQHDYRGGRDEHDHRSRDYHDRGRDQYDDRHRDQYDNRSRDQHDHRGRDQHDNRGRDYNERGRDHYDQRGREYNSREDHGSRSRDYDPRDPRARGRDDRGRGNEQRPPKRSSNHEDPFWDNRWDALQMQKKADEMEKRGRHFLDDTRKDYQRPSTSGTKRKKSRTPSPDTEELKRLKKMKQIQDLVVKEEDKYVAEPLDPDLFEWDDKVKMWKRKSDRPSGKSYEEELKERMEEQFEEGRRKHEEKESKSQDKESKSFDEELKEALDEAKEKVRETESKDSENSPEKSKDENKSENDEKRDSKSEEKVEKEPKKKIDETKMSLDEIEEIRKKREKFKKAKEKEEKEEGEIDDDEKSSKRNYRKHREDSREKSRNRESKSRKRSRSRDRKRSRSRDRKRSRDRSRDRYRRSRSRSPNRDRYRRSRSRDRDRYYTSFRSSRDGRNYRSSDRRDRGRSTRGRSRSRSPRNKFRGSRSEIDKAKLLAIAKKNAVKLLSSDNLMGMDHEKLIAIKSGGQSLRPLTDFCRELAAKGITDEFDDDDDILYGNLDDFVHPFEVKDKPLPNPYTSSGIYDEKLTPAMKKAAMSHRMIEFPVSSGNAHRVKEVDVKEEPIKAIEDKSEKSVEPEPEKSPEPSEAAKLNASNPLGVIMFGGVPEPPKELEAPKNIPMPDETPKETSAVFEAIEEPSKDISSIVSQRLNAMKKLSDNPSDPQALKELYEAQKEMSNWAESKNKPGQFTGHTGAKILTQAELSTGIQAWAKQEQFTKAQKVQGGFGEYMLKKMGWNQGEGLGKTRSGDVDPLTLDIKMDKKGFMAAEEGIKKRKKESDPLTLTACKDLSHKHPVSGLMELATKRKWGPPNFVQIFDCGPPHKKQYIFKVTVNGEDFQPTIASENKKKAKADAATVALQELGLLPKDPNNPL